MLSSTGPAYAYHAAKESGFRGPAYAYHSVLKVAGEGVWTEKRQDGSPTTYMTRSTLETQK